MNEHLLTGGQVHTQGHVPAAQAFRTAQAECLWNLLDGIPVFKVPDTLNWKLSHPFTDHLSGGIVLAYKVLVVFPALGLIAGLFGVDPFARTRLIRSFPL